jgi:hypothetical protein
MGSIGCSETPVTINQPCVTSLLKTLSYTAEVAWNHAPMWPNFHWQYKYNYSILSNIRSTKYLAQHYLLHIWFDGRVVFEELSLRTRYLIRFQSIKIIYHDTNRHSNQECGVRISQHILNMKVLWDVTPSIRIILKLLRRLLLQSSSTRQPSKRK